MCLKVREIIGTKEHDKLREETSTLQDKVPTTLVECIRRRGPTFISKDVELLTSTSVYSRSS